MKRRALRDNVNSPSCSNNSEKFGCALIPFDEFLAVALNKSLSGESFGSILTAYRFFIGYFYGFSPLLPVNILLRRSDALRCNLPMLQLT